MSYFNGVIVRILSDQFAAWHNNGTVKTGPESSSQD